MKSIWKIILLCLVYNAVCYGMIILSDGIAEGQFKVNKNWQLVALGVLIILVPLSVIVAECLGFSRNFTRKERIVYTLVWAAISVVIMFTVGDYGADGGFVKQNYNLMLNGIEYFLTGLLLCAAIPLLYLILWLEKEIRGRFKKR